MSTSPESTATSEALPASAESERSRKVLDPIDRVSEVLFGLIMVLTSTGTLSIAEAGRDDVHEMLIGAIGCNLAWGIIDAVMFLMGCLAEQARGRIALREILAEQNPIEAQRRIADTLPKVLARMLKPTQFAAIHEELRRLPREPARPRLRKQDWLGALGVFLLVVLSTFPVVVPFMFMAHAHAALRVSNVIAIVMLFFTGFVFGRCADHHPWIMGISMVIVGAALSGLAIALGG